MERKPRNIGSLERFQRQAVLPELGPDGQRAIGASRILVVGVGGLGSWAAELLARAGVGMLRLADDDRVDLTNIHRQALYDESDAAAGDYKVAAAARRLGRINSAVSVEAVPVRMDRHNVAELAGSVDLILDGTDNFAARFLINDFSVRAGLPWVFAGVVAAEGQVMPVLPGKTACLRCVFDAPPPPCMDPSCRARGVLGPAVAAIAAVEAMEAIKILSGRSGAVCGRLLKMDFWNGSIRQIGAVPRPDCPCCGMKKFEHLE